MKFSIFLFLSFISLPLLSNPFKINLVQDCTQEYNCKPQIWYLTDSFDKSFLTLTSAPLSWIRTDKFPIWLNKFFKKDTKVWTYSMVTFFDLLEDVSIERQTGIRLGEIGEVFEIYINGSLVAREGEITEDKVSFHRTVRGKVYEFNKSLLKPKENLLIVKISGDARFDHTGFYLTSGYEIGMYEELKYEEQDRITLILIGIYLTIGFYHLFLYFKRRKEKHNLYYALFIIGLGIYVYTRSSAIFEFNWDTVIIQRVELCVLYSLIFLIFALQEQIFFHKVRLVTKYYGYFLLIWSFLTTFLPMYIAEYLLRVWQVSFITLGVGITVNIIYTSVKQKLPNAKRLMFGMIFLIIAALFDILDSLVFNTGLAFAKYAFFIYVFGFATVLANNFIQVHQEIENLNDTLEKKVEIRTKELSLSLDHVNELKQQQDGDYYLTSLLIDPLGVNRSVKDVVNVEFLIRQKKKFSFKGNTSELGGDLCRSETIQLKNRNFTVFFNADAMGKSMQGAGGAIVVGAVFDSIIERTKLSKSVQNIYPERWLKNSFVELHKVFISFDCTMLVSIVVGLVDNASGLVYYINAEHPHPVLLRDGKSSFIGENFIYRKLGMPISESAYICVETFQLKVGDIFLSGSDGRDDIFISTPNGEKVLNSDENVFLRTVEKSGGNLDKILNILTTDGELTDDLSLLKISLSKNPFPIEIFDLNEIINISLTTEKVDREALDLEKKSYLNSKTINARTLKILTFGYVKLGFYTEAIRFGKDYLDLIPADDEMFFYISESLRRLKFYEEAIEIGERLRLRRKLNINNVINLAECYIFIDQYDRAKLLLHDVLLLDRNNVTALEILDRITG